MTSATDQPQPPNGPRPPDLDVPKPDAEPEERPAQQDVREEDGAVEPPD